MAKNKKTCEQRKNKLISNSKKIMAKELSLITKLAHTRDRAIQKIKRSTDRYHQSAEDVRNITSLKCNQKKK